MENSIDHIHELIKNVSKLETGGLIERGLKLSEESGELAAEILKLVDFKKNNLTKEQIRENILLESSDCLIVILDIMIHMGFSKEEIVNMSEKQINKWVSKHIDK